MPFEPGAHETGPKTTEYKALNIKYSEYAINGDFQNLFAIETKVF